METWVKISPNTLTIDVEDAAEIIGITTKEMYDFIIDNPNYVKNITPDVRVFDYYDIKEALDNQII